MRLILGTAQLTGRYGVMAMKGASKARAAGVLNAAGRLGIVTVDTAPGYEGAEVAIGEAVVAFAVHTKLPTAAEPAEALAASLCRLRRDRVEVLYLHDPEAVLKADNPQLAAASGLVGTGTKAIGASVYTREQFLAAVGDPRITVVQAPMNVFDRTIVDDDLCLAGQSGMEIIARSVLLQGLLGDPERAKGRVPPLDEAIAAFHEVCRRVGRAPVELAIGWVRSRPWVTGIVLGAETPEQLAEIVRVFNAPPLPEDEVDLLANLRADVKESVDPRTWPCI